MCVCVCVCEQRAGPTWVEGLHAAVQEADVHAAQVHDVEEGGDGHAPRPQQDPHQDVDGEQQVGQQEQPAPG